jgi:hypothetical protein
VAGPQPGRTGVLLVPPITGDKIVFTVEEAERTSAAQLRVRRTQARGSGHATNFGTERLAARAYQVEANNPK